MFHRLTLEIVWLLNSIDIIALENYTSSKVMISSKESPSINYRIPLLAAIFSLFLHYKEVQVFYLFQNS